MKRADIEEVFDHVRTWPPDQQERAAEILIALENADAEVDWLPETGEAEDEVGE